MIIKANIRTDGSDLADYLLSVGQYAKNKEKNEQIEIWEATGVDQGDTLQNILDDFEHSAAGTKCEKPLFHVKIRIADDETLTREQWLQGIDRLEEKLELTGLERVIVMHTLEGRGDHLHVVWNRIDVEKQKAAELHYYKHKCTDTARELEKEFGLRELSDDRKRGKLSRNEEEQVLRHDKDPEAVKRNIRESWQRADNGKAFTAALDEHHYLLARGDRRDFVIVGREGDVYSVARVTGSKVAQVRAKLADLQHENLPNVQEAKDIQQDRAQGRMSAYDQARWEDELAKAAVEKARQEERDQKQRAAKEREIRIDSDLGKTAGQIRLAYRLSESGEGFAAALEDRGLILARIGAEDARRQEQALAGAKSKADRKPQPKAFEEGELVVVDGYGNTYRLDQRTTGDTRSEIDKYLGTVDRASLLSLQDARNVAQEVREKQDQERELEKKQRAGHLGATLYDRAGMAEMQRDALRHLQDAHRAQAQHGLRPTHPDEHVPPKEAEKPQRQEAAASASQEPGVDDVRRSFWDEFRTLSRDQREEARDDKRARTEQTEYQRRKAERDDMREQFDVRQSPPSSNESEGREREREQE